MDSRAYPYGRFRVLTNGGRTATLLRPHERQNFNAVEITNKGEKREFRVRADHADWINEKNENNNVKLARFPLFKKK